MSSYRKLIGRWKSPAPWDSEDYRVAYEVSGFEHNPVVSATDLSDGEAFLVSNVDWDGDALTFTTLMPSTGRIGINRFSLDERGDVTAQFTFTVIEKLVRDEPLRPI